MLTMARYPDEPELEMEDSPPDIKQQMRELRTEVDRLSDCLRDSLTVQQTLLKQWDRLTAGSLFTPAVQQATVLPVATSTPHVAEQVIATSAISTSHNNPFRSTNPFLPASPILPSHSLDITNSSRVIAAALHRAKLEPPVYAGDNSVQPEDWLHAVDAYKSSLNLTDGQLINELSLFLAKEPGKWFRALRSHITSWAQFCQLFRTVFLPSDTQERILRGLLDRIQGQDEPLPTFVAHMLSEFSKLSSPPPEKDQIELISKRMLEKYRIALCGTDITAVMDLLLRAHELHSVLGSGRSPSSSYQGERSKPEPFCFKCSQPGVTTRTCPICNKRPYAAKRVVDGANVTLSQTSPGLGHSDSDQHEVDLGRTTAQSPFKQTGNYRGGRTFRRGHPSPSY